MWHLLTPQRNVLTESKNSPLKIKCLHFFFYGQNLANKGTQDTKTLDDSSEMLLLLPPSSSSTPRGKVAPEVERRKSWEGDLEVSSGAEVETSVLFCGKS